MSTRLVVLGAGPMGIEAALAASERGFEITVLEKDEVGSSLLRWGATKFFTPLKMNASPRLLSFASNLSEEALLTGPEMVEKILRPASLCPQLQNRIFTGHRVVSVGRTRMTRRDRPGHPMRGERSFRILTDTPQGEHVIEADCVLDATGLCLPTWVGAGGTPALGERNVAPRFIRNLGELNAPELASKKIMLVGHGHSAANAIREMAKVATEAPGTQITWVTRSAHQRPCHELCPDPLLERQAVAADANRLAQDPPPFLTVLRRTHILGFEAVEPEFSVQLSNNTQWSGERVVAMTGRRPDLSFLSELSLRVSPVSEGPDALYQAVSNITDCMSTPKIRDKNLSSGEPKFNFVGAKSYGRHPAFLLQTGRQQLKMILDSLSGKGQMI